MSDPNSTSGGPDPPTYDRWSLRDPSTLSYGYYSGSNNQSGASTSPTAAAAAPAPPAAPAAPPKGGYITTAINYTNGPAHIGHAYEGITADAVARFARLNAATTARAAYFVTGADEHGQKIAETAARQGKEPLEICDKVRLHGRLGWFRDFMIS